jgi:hypothetical protein
VNDAAVRARREAEELIVFCDGIEEGGFADYAQRGRVVARELIAALADLAAERSARVALQARCEVQQELLGKRVHDALVRSRR